ncbi:MAG: hypothetical protein V9E89_10950 [Ilumatobacteraceae bacterium]
MSEKRRRKLGKLGDIADAIEQAEESTFVEHVGKTVIVPTEVGEKRQTTSAAGAHEPWARLEGERSVPPAT